MPAIFKAVAAVFGGSLLLGHLTVWAQPVTAAPSPKAGAAPRWQLRPSPDCTVSDATIRITGPEVARLLGLTIGQVQTSTAPRILERNVELAYNANRYIRLSSRVPGITVEVPKDLGTSVQCGDVVVVIESIELAAAKAELLQAVEGLRLWETNASRQQTLIERGIGVQREALEAQTKAAEARLEVSKARQRLLNLGLSQTQIQQIEQNGESTSARLEIRAPLDGMIVERMVVLGELAEPGRPLLSIADMTTLWAKVDLLESDLAVVKVGQKAQIRLDAFPDQRFEGILTWISTQVDEKTRTVEARLEVGNPNGVLRANMFGKAFITVSDASSTLTIPKEAVQWDGCCNIAFVQADHDPLLFTPTRLTLGFDTGDRYEVLDGLHGGERIVTSGSFILKNELIKDSIGAGCCEVEHLHK